jgi:Tfp pilus assembly protein PilO
LSIGKQRLTPKTLAVLVGVAGVVVLALGLFMLVLPQRHKAAGLTDQISQTQTQIFVARSAATKTPEERVPVTNLFKLAKAMPDQTDMTGIILQLQKTADESGVELASIQPGSPAAGVGYTTQPLNLTIDGKFFAVTKFLETLRRLVTVRSGKLDARGRLFTVSDIHFGPGARGFPSLGAVMDVNAYVYSGGSGTTPAPVPTATPTTTEETTPSSSAAVASGATN